MFCLLYLVGSWTGRAFGGQIGAGKGKGHRGNEKQKVDEAYWEIQEGTARGPCWDAGYES